MKTTTRILSIIAILALLAGCAPAPIPAPTAAVAPPPTGAPTPESTATPTTYQVQASEQKFTEQQLALNDSESAIKQIEAQDRYLEYWSKFKNRPFDPNTVELKRKFVYDDPNNSTEVLVLLEALGEYNGRTFTVPIGAGGQFAEYPPEVSGDNIEPGFGPLELSGGADGQWLSVENGIPVRRNSAGEIVERLNMEKKQWEVVDVAFDTLFKSEKYPLFGGFDMSEAKLDAGTFYFRDALPGKTDTGADLFFQTVMEAFADQQGMTQSDFLELLKKNNYVANVRMFASSGFKNSLLKPVDGVQIDFKKPIKVVMASEAKDEYQPFGINQKINGILVWQGAYVKDGQLIFVESKLLHEDATNIRSLGRKLLVTLQLISNLNYLTGTDFEQVESLNDTLLTRSWRGVNSHPGTPGSLPFFTSYEAMCGVEKYDFTEEMANSVLPLYLRPSK